MSYFKFEKGLEFNLGGVQYTLHSEIDDGWQVEDSQGGRIVFIKTHDLLEHYRSGVLVPILTVMKAGVVREKNYLVEAMFDELEESEKLEVKAMLSFVKHFIKSYPHKKSIGYIERVLGEYWKQDEMGRKPSGISAYRALRKYVASDGDPNSLIKRKYLRGNRRRRIAPEVLAICERAINNVYLTKARPTVETTHTEVLASIKLENRIRLPSQQLKAPSVTTLRNMIKKYDRYEVVKGRYGKHTADMEFRNVLGHTPSEGVNSRWEIDHTPFDVVVLDDDYGIPIGRPSLTTIIDCGTHCIMAAHVSFQTNSTIRVAQAIKEAIFPKTSIREEYPSIDGDWACYGIPDYIAHDQGLELIGSSTQSLFHDLNIDTATMPMHRGDKKGMVERMGGVIVASITERLPGKTFNSISEKPFGYNPKRFASITLSTLREMVYKFIVDYYHQRPKDAIGMSPMQKWIEAIKHRSPRLPPNQDYVDARIGLVEYRRLTHKGIEFQNMLYNSKELGMYARSQGHHELKIRYNPEDLGHIIVMTKDSGYIRVPANRSYFDYACGTSLPMHVAIKQRLKSQRKGNSPEELALTRHEIHKSAMVAINKDRKRLKKTSIDMLKFMPAETSRQEAPLMTTPIQEVSMEQDLAWHEDDIPDLDAI